MENREVVSINGEIVDLNKGSLSVLDHCVLFGDGVFEGMRFINYRILLHKEHMQRLYKSAKVLRLSPIPQDVYQKWLFEAVRVSNLSSGYIRVILTRGIGGLDLNPTKCNDPKLIIIIANLKLYSDELYQKGIRLVVAKINKTPYRSFDCRVKSCNYLNNLMALWEAIDQGASEAIMTDENGIVSESAMSNIFGISNQELFTPSLETNCLEGITRAKIIELAVETGLKVHEGRYPSRDFMLADEVFLTGTGAGIMPVNQINHQTIGEGSIGKITQMLRNKYEQRLESLCTSIN